MKLPAIKGVIRRRILLNYRIAPEVVQRVIPDNFKPKVVNGFAVAGICLIRLEQIRAKGLPAFLGVSSENSAHRFAVEWDDGGAFREGVFVPRRDTDSRLNALLGGRVFPGEHHHTHFSVREDGGQIRMCVESRKESPLVDLNVSESEKFPEESIFSGLEESSKFFENGSVGYSARANSRILDGLLLKVDDWQVSSLEVNEVSSAYFDDRRIFPEGSIAFDHALLMRDIDHEWHSEPDMVR